MSLAGGWLNKNSLRSYPFVETAALAFDARDDYCIPYDFPLPDDAILDFGCDVGPGAGFDETTESVFLVSVSRIDGQFRFEFSSDNPVLAAAPLVFWRDVDDDEFASDYADSPDLSGPRPCPRVPPWRGFLTTGSLSRLTEVLTDDNQTLLAGTTFRIEPALVRNDGPARSLRSVSLANYRDVRYSDDECAVEDTQAAYVGSTMCVVGGVLFYAGYNFHIDFDEADNAIEFSAEVGAGEGEPCVEIPTHADEIKPGHGLFYSGGPACSEVVKWFAGAHGPDVEIEAGPGFVIEPHPTDTHGLVVRLAFTDVRGCAGDG